MSLHFDPTSQNADCRQNRGVEKTTTTPSSSSHPELSCPVAVAQELAGGAALAIRIRKAVLHVRLRENIFVPSRQTDTRRGFVGLRLMQRLRKPRRPTTASLLRQHSQRAVIKTRRIVACGHLFIETLAVSPARRHLTQAQPSLVTREPQRTFRGDMIPPQFPPKTNAVPTHRTHLRGDKILTVSMTRPLPNYYNERLDKAIGTHARTSRLTLADDRI